jgi:hypothetical protein
LKEVIKFKWLNEMMPFWEDQFWMGVTAEKRLTQKENWPPQRNRRRISLGRHGQLSSKVKAQSRIRLKSIDWDEFI